MSVVTVIVIGSSFQDDSFTLTLTLAKVAPPLARAMQNIVGTVDGVTAARGLKRFPQGEQFSTQAVQEIVGSFGTRRKHKRYRRQRHCSLEVAMVSWMNLGRMLCMSRYGHDSQHGVPNSIGDSGS